MARTKTVLLTGATGFLGSHLCVALLREGHRVVAIARPSKSATARSRVLDIVRNAAASTVAVSDFFDRLEVIVGDLTAKRMGLSAIDRARLEEEIDEVWHSAASLSFLEEDRASIFSMNADGTERVLELATRTRSRRLHHVSTAYIAGRRKGVIGENEIDVGQEFKNPYEASKCQAEMTVAQAQKEERIRASVYRPSIVIGDSTSGRATHFHGVYAFIRGLWAASRRARRGKPEGTVVELPLRVTGSGKSTLNFVPINYVTEAMIEIGKQEAATGRTFHLTNPAPTENDFWLNIVCDQLRIRGVRLVGEDAYAFEPMTRLESIFHRQMAFYHPYLGGEPAFDCRATLEALKRSEIRCPDVTPEFARKITGWYIDRLNSGAL